MSLLDHYIRAVRIYLPRGPQQTDILNELRDHLQTRLDEREEALGRPLTDGEEEAVLAEHGDPLLVAERYGHVNVGLSFGRQLIGPKLFPLYIRILGFQLALTVAVLLTIRQFSDARPGGVAGVLVPMLLQFIVTTTVFGAIDLFQRRSARTGAPGASWSFPPPYLQQVPKWQSLAGLISIGLVALWWALVPYMPSLLLGGRAGALQIVPLSGWLYWTALAVMLLGAAQRAATLVRPDWNWLQPITRLVTNGAGLALLYPLLQSYPYVVVGGARDVEQAAAAAGAINSAIWWHLLTSAGLYWLIVGGFMAWLCLQHLRYQRRRGRPAPVSNGLRLC
jgi:hypothetical protein